MKTLCFGGTFNPIHHGHLLCARAVAEEGGFGRVTLIPSAHPPHKSAPGAVVAAEDRLAMCRLAVEGEPLFDVSSIELERGGLSYTIDTVRLLKSQGDAEIYWLIGGDTVPFLPTWHQPEALLDEVRFIVMARPGRAIDWDALPERYRSLRLNVVPAPLIDIDATEIRRRLRAGRSVAYLTPQRVIEYIRARQLYVDPPAAPARP